MLHRSFFSLPPSLFPPLSPSLLRGKRGAHPGAKKCGAFSGRCAPLVGRIRCRRAMLFPPLFSSPSLTHSSTATEANVPLIRPLTPKSMMDRSSLSPFSLFSDQVKGVCRPASPCDTPGTIVQRPEPCGRSPLFSSLPPMIKRMEREIDRLSRQPGDRHHGEPIGFLPSPPPIHEFDTNSSTRRRIVSKFCARQGKRRENHLLLFLFSPFL